MDNKYIFVPYEGIFETNIFLKEIFDANTFLKGIFYANILCAEGEKKTYLQRDIRSKFMSYISL